MNLPCTPNSAVSQDTRTQHTQGLLPRKRNTLKQGSLARSVLNKDATSSCGVRCLALFTDNKVMFWRQMNDAIMNEVLNNILFTLNIFC